MFIWPKGPATGDHRLFNSIRNIRKTSGHYLPVAKIKSLCVSILALSHKNFIDFCHFEVARVYLATLNLCQCSMGHNMWGHIEWISCTTKTVTWYFYFISTVVTIQNSFRIVAGQTVHQVNPKKVLSQHQKLLAKFDTLQKRSFHVKN